jgi:hypothetical protein
MDVLRCKRPELVRKEIWMHVLAYNLIHAVMAPAASQNGISPPEARRRNAIAQQPARLETP